MKPPPSKAKTETITKLIAYVIVGDMRPVSLVEGKHFKTLFNYLEPGYVIPSRHTFTRRIEHRYASLKANFQRDFDNVTFMGLTFDMWTSAQMQSFLGVTTQYFSANGAELSACLLAVKEVGEAHTGENIARWISFISDEYQLSGNQIVACVTDNDSNMVSAMQILDAIYRWVHFRCAAHTLQLCVHDCLKRKYHCTSYWQVTLFI